MSDVFISYKAEDRPRVRPLVEALEAEGLAVVAAVEPVERPHVAAQIAGDELFIGGFARGHAARMLRRPAPSARGGLHQRAGGSGT